jgi:hypothetical protein
MEEELLLVSWKTKNEAWKDTKMVDLREVKCAFGRWIKLVQDRVQ